MTYLFWPDYYQMQMSQLVMRKTTFKHHGRRSDRLHSLPRLSFYNRTMIVDPDNIQTPDRLGGIVISNWYYIMHLVVDTIMIV